MIRKIICFLLAGWLGVTTELSAAPARLAIVAESPEVQTAADLFTATLSTVDSLMLLERAQIEKIRAEQQLSTLNERGFLKLGQILGADGVLVLNLDRLDGKTNVYTRLAAVKPGAVVSVNQAVWPLENLGAWATNQLQHYQPHWAKLSVAAANALPVSVLNIRSAVQSPRSQALEQELTIALINRLTHEPELFVLERRSLQLLSNEKELINTNDSPFWNGAYLLEGTLDRDGISEATATIHARLMPPKGGTPITLEISGIRTNAAQLADLLTRKIMEGLSRTPQAGGWKPEVEAARYMAEAEWAFRWKMYPAAQAASESAWALGLHSDACAKLLIESYVSTTGPWGIRNTYVVNGILMEPALEYQPRTRAIQEMMRAQEFYSLQTPIRKSATGQLSEEWFKLGLRTIDGASTVLQEYYFYAKGSNQVGEILGQLRKSTRDLAEQMSREFPEANRIAILQLKARSGALWQDTPQAGMEMYRQMLHQGDFARVRQQVMNHTCWEPCLAGWEPLSRAQSTAWWRRFMRQLTREADDQIRMEGAFLGLAYAENDQDLENSTALLWTCLGRMLPGTGTVEASTYPEAVMARDWLRKKILNKKSATISRLESKYLVAPAHPHPATQPAVTPTKPVSSVVPATKGKEVVPMENKVSTQPERALELRNYCDIADIFPANRAWHLVEVFCRDEQIWIEARQDLVASGWSLNGLYGAFGRFIPGQERPKFAYLPARNNIPYNYPYLRSNMRTFEVFKGQVYATADDHLLRFDERSGKWESLPVPIQGDALIQAGKTALYLCTRDSILEYHPENGTTRVLASCRRTPPLTELDKISALNYPSLFVTTNGTIHALIMDSIYQLDVGAADWRLIRPVVKTESLLGLNDPEFWRQQAQNWRVARDGVVFNQISDRGRIWQLTTEGTLRLLWQTTTPRSMRSISQTLHERTFTNRATWKPPQGLSVSDGPAVCDGNQVWWLDNSVGHPQSALWHFDFSGKQVKRIPFRISQAPPEITVPYSVMQKQDKKCPQLVAYSGGLILVATNGFGFWHVPAKDLQPFLTDPVQTVALIPEGASVMVSTNVMGDSPGAKLLKRYDRDGNGGLNVDELEGMRGEEKQKPTLDGPARLMIPPGFVSLRMFDTNKDQSLDQNELDAMVNRIRLVPKVSTPVKQ